jgi:hypothetical protein
MSEMKKDWNGNSNSIYMTLGASNHTDKQREQYDYYATEPKALELLLEKEGFSPYVWECACGEGHLSEVLKSHGYIVKSSDLIDRGYYGTEVIDFLKISKQDVKNDISRDIITNPPYKYAKEFVEHALEVSMDGTKIAMFLKVQFLEGKARRKLFDKHPPKTIYVASSRLLCAKNGEFEKMRQGGGSAVAYAWFIWEKGFSGEPVVRWFN